MKHTFILTLMLMFMVACTSGGSAERPNCSKGGWVCVKLEVAEPTDWGEPVEVTITVNADKDLPDLSIGLNYDRGAIVEDPQGWEIETEERKVDEFAASWKADLKANETQVFVRKVRFPLIEKEFRLLGWVARSDLDYLTDSATVDLTRKGGEVYYSGTPVSTMPLSGLGTGRNTTSEGVNCGQGPCLTIRIADPVHWGEPVRALLQIEGRKEGDSIAFPGPYSQIAPKIDFLELGVTFSSPDPSVRIASEKGEFRDQMAWPAGNGVWWVTDVRANHTQEYTFLVDFPLEERDYYLIAEAFDPDLGQVSSDNVMVHLGREGGKVFAPSLGTPRPTVTPWPTRTPLPPTVTPSPSTTPYPPPEEPSRRSYPPPAMPYP